MLGSSSSAPEKAQKSKHTEILEKIIQALIVDSSNVSIQYQHPNQYYIGFKKEKVDFFRRRVTKMYWYDLADLLKYSDFKEIALSEHDYERILKSKDDECWKHYPSLFMYTASADRSIGEAIEAGAIRLYTDALYASLNPLMRGEIRTSTNNDSPDSIDSDIKSRLLLATIITNGIARDMIFSIPAKRYERDVPESVLDKRDRMVFGTKKYSRMKAFTSTSVEGGEPYLGGNVVILFDNARGRNIAKFSTYDAERELLIPPSSYVKFYSKEQEGDTTIYRARLLDVVPAKKLAKPKKYKL